VTDKFIFENLDVYQKALKFSIDISKLTSNFPIKYSRIQGQFIGAAISIPLNIAEGNGRNTTKDKINFYKFAKSSCFECVPLIDICLNLELIDNKKVDQYRQEIKEITSMISGLVKYQKQK